MLSLFLALSIGQIPQGCSGGLTVLTYGDSKTVEAVAANNNEEIWQDFLVWFSGCHVNINIGTGASYKPGSIATNGITTAQRKAAIDADLLLVKTTPNVVLYNLGSNDAFFGDAEVVDEAAWKGNLRYILDAMRTKWPTIKVLYSETWRGGFDAESDRLATWYTDVAAEAAYVGWFTKCDNERDWMKGSDAGVAMTRQSDGGGIHYSVAGSIRKAQLASACLATIQ